MNQTIIPVIQDHKSLRKFLQTSLTWCVLMDFHINFMEDIIKELHQAKRKVFVHMDLIHGVSNDRYGVQFLCQKYHVDGMISTKPSAIEEAKKNHCISILRIFLIDSKSLKKGSILAKELQPDYVEVLPAMLPFACEATHQYHDIDVIGGGLIRNKEDIDACLSQGMVGITTSCQSLWDEVCI